MRKNIGKMLSLLVILLVPFMTCYAATEDYFVSSSNNDGGEVNHSVFVANENVNYDKKVNGIGFIAGNNVTINGETEYGFYAGNNVIIKDTINKDLFVAGNTINVSKDATLGRDLYAAGNIITVSTNIEGNVFIAGDEITLDNVTINGDVNLTGSKLNIDGNVTILGTIKYNEDMAIGNQNNLNATNKETYKVDKEEKQSIFSNTLYALAMVMILAFVINLLFPKLYKNTVKEIDGMSTLKNILFGLLWLIGLPIASIVIMCTVVGLELGLVVLMVYAFMLMISVILSSMVLGYIILTKLFKTTDNSYLAITIGLIIFKLVSLIPIVGGWIYFLAILYGMGKVWELFLK